MTFARSGRIRAASRLIAPWLLGAATFFFITGGAILRPTDFRWLLPGDGGMNLLGWMFFRNEPFWQQPFGAVWAYGMSISGSLVYSDSIPLMAFLFKPFAGFLSTDFQYFGLWTLLCFLLQAFFGWKLLERMSGEKSNLLTIGLGTLFFLIAPAFVWRIHWHLALGSHWIVLASLYLYFSSRPNVFPWIALCLVASLLTPILLAMVLPLFGAALVRNCQSGKLKVARAIGISLLTCLLLGFTTFEAGYFLIHDVGEGGFGIYRSSIFSFFEPAVGDPSGGNSWSYVIPNQMQGPGTYEGYAYLGLGIILMAVVSLIQLLRSRRFEQIPSEVWPLLIVLAAFTLFAWSNQIGPAKQPLVQIIISFNLERIIAPFRASGRYIWPLYYFVIAGIISFLIRSFRKWTSVGLLTACLILQIVDSSRALIHNRALYGIDFAYALQSPFWEQAANRYQKIVYVLPRDLPVGFFPLCYLAASHHLPITLCHYGRRNEQNIEAADSQTFDQLQNSGLDPEALYVFQNGALWSVGISKMGPGDLAGYSDDLAYIAPKWGMEAQQNTRSLLRMIFPDYQPGTVLKFGRDGNGLPYLANGWSTPEAEGIWSTGAEASLIIPLAGKTTSDLILDLKGLAFVGTKWPKQIVGVSANGMTIANFTCRIKDPARSWSIRIPSEALDKDGTRLTLTLSTPDSVIPADLGLFLDSRKIGFALESVNLRPAQ